MKTNFLIPREKTPQFRQDAVCYGAICYGAVCNGAVYASRVSARWGFQFLQAPGSKCSLLKAQITVRLCAKEEAGGIRNLFFKPIPRNELQITETLCTREGAGGIRNLLFKPITGCS